MVTRCAEWLAVLVGLASPAPAEGCRLALLLALDVSGSVSPSDDLLQRQGLARALLAPEVSEAFLRGDPVALHVFEWADASYQTPLLPDWQMIRDEEDLARVAEAIEVTRALGLDRSHRRTALGEALAHAHQMLDQGPDCRGKTLDVSGDGRSNEGRLPSEVYAQLPWGSVTVNALVIQGPTREWGITRYFERHVLRGPGAFFVEAQGYADYQRAMEAKLLRELEQPLAGRPASAPSIDRSG
jgi:hypothetical protein